MPISLSSIASNQATVTFRYGEDSVSVVYFPGRVTEKTLADLQGFASLTTDNVVGGFGSLNETLAHLIASWDVYEDDAQTVMFPLDAGRLSELPIPFRTQVLQAIMGDIRPEAMAPQVQNSQS